MDINKQRLDTVTGTSQRLHNYAMERNMVSETKGVRKRRYKQIIEELGKREISLIDLTEGVKNKGVLDAILEKGGSLDDFVILQQYAKAIVDGDTKAAEFLRDTSGQKPTTSVDLATNTGGLSEMSLEDLNALREELVAANENEKKDE